MLAGYIYGLLQAGAVPAMLLLPTGKAKEKKGVRLIKNFAYFVFEKTGRKKFSWNRFWVGKEILSEKGSPRRKTFCRLCF